MAAMKRDNKLNCNYIKKYKKFKEKGPPCEI